MELGDALYSPSCRLEMSLVAACAATKHRLLPLDQIKRKIEVSAVSILMTPFSRLLDICIYKLRTHCGQDQTLPYPAEHFP